MKTGLLIGTFASLLWFCTKLAFFGAGLSTDSVNGFVFLNMFLATFAVAFGLYLIKKKGLESNILMDIKNAMVPGVSYAVLTSIFIFLYYGKIDKSYNERQLSNEYAKIDRFLSDSDSIKKIKMDNPQYMAYSKEQLFSEIKKSPEMFFSAEFTMTISLLALMVYVTLNSVLIAVIYRRFIFRNNFIEEK
jgi:hypothetical protein